MYFQLENTYSFNVILLLGSDFWEHTEKSLGTVDQSAQMWIKMECRKLH